MPDIDTDIEDSRRDEVIEHVRKKYGHNRVSGIITFGTLGAKQSVRDVCRVMDIPISSANEIAKMIPDTPGTKLVNAFKGNPDLKNRIESDKQLEDMWNHALKLEGMCRHASKHAAGILIGEKPLDEIVPMYKEAGVGDLVSQFDGSVIETCGLLKMDFLGLKNLTVIQKSLEHIKKNRNVSINIDELPLDDAKTYALLQSGNTNGCFQLVSKGMQELMIKLKPDRFEDIIVLISLYRPGPIKFADEYIQRKHGRKPITYPHPSLEAVLKDTYGIIVYQEHVMQIAREIAGFNLGEADALRKGMGKKKKEEIAGMKIRFFEGAKERNIPDKTVTELWDAMSEFAGYGFNKSHATPYGLIAYQTAYLKANYPVEYMTALMSVYQSKTGDLVKYINDCRDMQIEILVPDINSSEVDFSVEGEQIRFGLQAIKNVGQGVAEAIYKERKKKGKYTSIHDLTKRVKSGSINRRTLEGLIKSGALTSTKYNRSSLFQAIDDALEFGIVQQREANSNQMSLFGADTPANTHTPKIHPIEEWDQLTLLQNEKEVLGLYLSDHPLKKHQNLFKEILLPTTEEIKDKDYQYSLIYIGAILHTMKVKTAKRDQERYADIILEDIEGRIEALLFPKTFAKYKDILIEDKVYIWLVRKDNKDENKYFVDEIIELNDVNIEDIKNKQNKLLCKSKSIDGKSPIKEKKQAYKQYVSQNGVKNNGKALNVDSVGSTTQNVPEQKENINDNVEQVAATIKPAININNVASDVNSIQEGNMQFENSFIHKEEMIPAAKFDSRIDCASNLHIVFTEQELSLGVLENIKKIMLEGNSGNSQVFFHLDSGSDKEVTIKAGKSFKVNANENLLTRLKQVPVIKQVYVS